MDRKNNPRHAGKNGILPMGSGTQLQSTIRCPQCGFQKTETMPVDSCRVMYECRKCQTILRPKSGDCCVFCSYGTVSCPPRQAKPLGE